MRRKSDRPEEGSREVRHRNSHAGSQFLNAQSGIQMSVDIFFNAPQRIPVHVRIDNVPPDVRLVAGITATVRIASP
jgi:hypothetical protein